MPELTQKASHNFWKSYHDDTIYRVICFMEGVEDWTLDGNPSVEKAMADLGKSLDKLGEVDLQQEKHFVDLVSHIKTGRGLRLLMALDEAYPGAAAKVLMYAEENTDNASDMASIFLKRNMVFERLRLLSRIFSPERFKLVSKALEESRYE